MKQNRFFGCCNRRVVVFGKKVSKYLTAKGNHYFWLDEYEKMTSYDFEKYFDWCIARKGVFGWKIVCCKTCNSYRNK